MEINENTLPCCTEWFAEDRSSSEPVVKKSIDIAIDQQPEYYKSRKNNKFASYEHFFPSKKTE